MRSPSESRQDHDGDHDPIDGHASQLIPHGSNSTCNALIDWALKIVLERTNKEANCLVDPIHGFLRMPGLDRWSWEMVLTSWSMLKCEETIATVAPAIFAVATTVAVNSRTRTKLDKAAVRADEEPNAGSDGEEEDPGASVETSPMVSKIEQRDPWQAVTAVILVLLYFCYRFALVFPMLIGLFAFTCNTNRELVSLLCCLGMAVSYQTTLATLHVLAADSDAHLKLLSAFTFNLGPQFLILFDNVNKMKWGWQPTLGHKDEFKSGTALTIIELEDVLPGILHSEPLIEKIQAKARLNLTVKQLRDDIDWPHIRGIGAGTVLRIWLKYLPTMSHHRAAVEKHFTVTHAKHPLRLRKSKIHTTRVSNIDKSTTVGAANVLRYILGQLLIPPISLFKWMIMVCGDQLSINHIHKIICYTAKGDTPYEQHKWALPIIQLWHLKWAWQKAILRLHWHLGLEKGTFGLHHNVVFIEHEKFNHNKCDFYPAHHILEDRFETLVLNTLHLLCQQHTDFVTPTETKLIDALQLYFEPEGPLSACTFEQLHEFATIVYDRYMCSAAADDASGHLRQRDVKMYGEPWSSEVINEEPEMLQSMTAAAAQPERKFSKGDQVPVTLCNFMWVTLWYMELSLATAEGDIRHVFEVIKVLCFSFWGAGSTNYGNELLELACSFLYKFSANLITTVLNNYLVNPSGRIGHWLELDLLQKHFNFWIKCLFNAKSHDFDSKHLSKAVGLNITSISKLRETFPGLFRLKRNGQRHTDASTVHDINKLSSHFRKNHILKYEAGCDQRYVVKNEFGTGHAKLQEGQLAIFLNRTAGGDSATGNENEPAASSEQEYPANPITVSEAVMDIGVFITGE
ncbi:hypothetical protein K438DRAFT_1609227 [Mycena galopus ATCC 62051]|nr:hypothetical protein K438DRAFT_1609227 [Mycena galopus ATCC 62051]